jgi:hypothetical protein
MTLKAPHAADFERPVYLLLNPDPPCHSAGSTLSLPMQVAIPVGALREVPDLQHTHQILLQPHRPTRLASMTAAWQRGVRACPAHRA